MSDRTSTTTDGRVTQPLQADKSLGELFGDFTSDIGLLLRQEVELAKTEAKAEATRAGKGIGMFAGAGLGGWMAVLFLSLALAWLLDQAMNTALAFAIVGVLWAVVAAVLALRGKRQMAAVKPIPETVNTLKEDVQWAKTQNS
jgi:F0F1-type ATP synthase assembly protein I